MKNLIFLATITVFFLTACSEQEQDLYGLDFGDETSLLTLKSGYEMNIVSPIEKPADFEYSTKGIVEYSKDGVLIATIDYGDGTKDVWASLEINGDKKNIDLSAKKKGGKYKKVISSPLIKIEGCDYIVSGTIKYFAEKKWVATVEYGDGTCDKWATKTWKGGKETFSLDK
jgi:hypothetical protein